MRVEFIRPAAGFKLGYHVGEIAEVEDDLAMRLFEIGVVVHALEKVEDASSKEQKRKAVRK